MSDGNMVKKTHAAKKDLSVTEVPGVVEIHSTEWGGYSVNFAKWKELGDMSPLLEGLPDNMCDVPHWGYLFKGKMVLKYKDRVETINAGDAFYMEPGHVPTFTEEGTEWLTFSPKKEDAELNAVFMENLKKGKTAKKPE